MGTRAEHSADILPICLEKSAVLGSRMLKRGGHRDYSAGFARNPIANASNLKLFNPLFPSFPAVPK
jgi:hypothetical protein